MFALLIWFFAGGWGGNEVDFNHEIRPILNSRCITCHGGVKRAGGFSLLFRVDALDTTESGKHAIVPGDPGASEMIRLITHHDPDERMPAEGPPLTGEQIDLLKRWIEQGAPWADHWAYIKPEPRPLPDVSDSDWPTNGIDHFVLARLEEEELSPTRQADCATLIRRVSLDLIGLPPTPAEADAFCKDPSDAAYEQVVDRLLASPRYGERWASMWLDLARYADSQGYEKDGHRTIWSYRDWVIGAFNQDMPFDQFTIEQLAGDLLPDPTKDQLVATAFHRNTMTNTEGGTDDEEFRTAAVIDRLNTTWEVWQGTTIACVQCHSHPYDPFRHEEFYQLYAFFNNTADADRDNEAPTLVTFADTLSEQAKEEGRRLVAELEDLEEQMDSAIAQPELADSFQVWKRLLRAHVLLPQPPPTFGGHVLPLEIIRIGRQTQEERSGYERERLEEFYASVAPAFTSLREERDALEGALSELEPIRTPILRELPPEERRVTRMFDRGSFLSPTKVVKPEVPGSMPSFPENAPRNRLGLAKWLVSPENPLTARVIVNRFWDQFFGTGIVETLGDFGTEGMPPTHRELLDWLALQFMNEHQWSIKGLLKQIVTSSTYRQSSVVTPEALEADPNNRLLARGPRFRLSAEQIRDQALAVSGLLSDKRLGPSVMPPQPPGLWDVPYSGTDWVTSEGEDRYRRALYTYWRRTVPYPSMIAFDAPSREICVSRRIRTNTPLQALVTLNDPVYVEAAQALARRMKTEGGRTIDAQLRHGYKLALLHEPRAETIEVLKGLYEDALRHYRQEPEQRAAFLTMGLVEPEEESKEEASELAALAVAAHAILNLDSFVTKE